MGSASQPNRSISPQVMNAIHALLNTATISGLPVIDVTQDAGRMLDAMPDCDLNAEEIASAIEKISMQHSFFGIVLGRSNALT